MPRISKYARSIRGGLVKLRRAISGSIGKFSRAIRERWLVLTITILFICAPIYAMAWYLDVFTNIASSITMTLVATALPLIQLFSPPEPLTKSSYVGWFSAFTLIALFLFIGDEYESRFISFSVILVLLASPYGWIFWQILRHEWLLSVGFVLALAATMIYWIAALIVNKEGFDLLLLPLPVVLFSGVLWAPIALGTLKGARMYKDRNIAGPGLQALAMTMLFLPVTLVAITLPTDLGLTAMWSNVSLALIGIFLSGVISEPLRRLFVEWGKLDPDAN